MLGGVPSNQRLVTTRCMGSTHPAPSGVVVEPIAHGTTVAMQQVVARKKLVGWWASGDVVVRGGGGCVPAYLKKRYRPHMPSSVFSHPIMGVGSNVGAGVGTTNRCRILNDASILAPGGPYLQSPRQVERGSKRASQKT